MYINENKIEIAQAKHFMQTSTSEYTHTGYILQLIEEHEYLKIIPNKVSNLINGVYSHNLGRFYF